jgi:hypothetical protein
MPQEFAQRRLPASFDHHAAGAGQMLADRTGQDRTAAAGPIERCGTGDQPDHVVAVLRQGARDDFRADSQLVEQAHRIGEHRLASAERTSLFSIR